MLTNYNLVFHIHYKQLIEELKQLSLTFAFYEQKIVNEKSYNKQTKEKFFLVVSKISQENINDSSQRLSIINEHFAETITLKKVH